MKISIIGAAGTVGSCTAFALSDRGLARDLVMIDINHELLTNHLNDIKTAISDSQSLVLRSGDYSDMAGSRIVIIAAGKHLARAANLELSIKENLPIISEAGRNIARYCPDAVVITATNPLDPLNYVLQLVTSMPRYQLIGYSLNHTTRFRMAVAEVLGVGVSRVEAFVLGRHPGAQVPLFSSIKVDGGAVKISNEQKQAIREKSRNYLLSLVGNKSGRTAGWTTAYGIARMTKAIAIDECTAFPCSVVADGEYGLKGMSISLPAVITRTGITQVIDLELAEEEKDELRNVAVDLQQDCRMAAGMLTRSTDEQFPGLQR